MKTIGIVGSRRRNKEADRRVVIDAFNAIFEEGDRLVSGGCWKGADSFAETIAKGRGLTITIHYPDWERAPRTAGFNRNSLIAEDADILIACPAKDRTGGTEDTIRKFMSKRNYKKKNLILV